ncbi:MAG: isoprenylcysteine carboxylmethyltransferase family protein [Tissierellia bacterium]|nr:isoprenylcysteine carboxylmethyltransferase family protein [Tissierellia bacterium]
MDKKELLKNAVLKFVVGVIGTGFILFASAGTFAWWNAWAFMAVLFLPMMALGVFLFLKEPALLEKRLEMKETEEEQKSVIKVSSLLLLIGFILPGIDFRFAWSHVPLAVVIVSCILVLLGYGLFVYVLKTNAYASRTVNIQDNQKLIDYGPYKIVRHPMYTATLFIFIISPLVLGSWFGFAVMLFYPFLLKIRIDSEEKVLTSGLKGYSDYKKAVKWRLIPYIW